MYQDSWPVYPYDRLEQLRLSASSFDEGVIDLSVGTPYDLLPTKVMDALAASNSANGYPFSQGSVAVRKAAADWMKRRFEVVVDPQFVGMCIGAKEFIASLPRFLKLAWPDKDTVLYPEVSYPTYADSARLAGLRSISIPVYTVEEGKVVGKTGEGLSGKIVETALKPEDKEVVELDLSHLDQQDIQRALVLWVNSPNNPTGKICNLDSVVEWGDKNNVLIASDECYVEFTWDRPPSSIIQNPTGFANQTGHKDMTGVLSIHSLSKRSNAAGLRAAFYTGDAELVTWLVKMRKFAGLMVPGPVQDAAQVALEDDSHVETQRSRYLERLNKLIEILGDIGVEAKMPQGGFYLWVDVGDGWGFTKWLATTGGALVSPGEFYSADALNMVRVAAVQPLENLDILAMRLKGSKWRK
ncbi:MAG: aminotransferase class I/II-fold pyridoxal phosphate-dependent enzyme [Actinobacteria bacterium]|nr:aminotransferase class I/II-fold pyridoxal phosphate-dependent enzyme [Actinomycetota bacterium]MCL6104328.1 aminotransferase class I/II-fold pyridoxal phosphate-dependent enzyme [Actinomycetota bacterium]